MENTTVGATAFLHHIAFESSDPLAMAEFYAANMDMKLEQISDDEVRCEGPLRRMIFLRGTDKKLAYGALACRTGDDLAAYRTRAQAAGIEITATQTPYFSDGAFSVTDNDGHRIVFGLADTPTVAYRPNVTGLHAPLQHLTFATQNLDGFVDFYVNKMGFALSDRVVHDDGSLATAFTTTNHEHHTIACFKSDRTGVDHHSYEAGSMEQIKQFCDRFAENDVLLTWGPGRHGPGNNLFVFYTDPDGNWIEISGELENIYDRDVIDWPQHPRTLNKWGKAILRS